MIKVQILALILLIARLVSVCYLNKTLRTQKRLLRLRIDNDDDGEIKRFRLILHRMTLVVFYGQIIPIALDIQAVLFPDRRVFWLGVLYAISNAFTALTAAVLIWRIYQLAEHPAKVTELEREHVKKTQQGV